MVEDVLNLRLAGGSGLTMPKDFDQAKKMLNMRIKIDVWSHGLDETIRVEIRENLRDLFCQLPPRRVWLFLKHTRHMQLTRKKPEETGGSNLAMNDLMDGPEDVIANSEFLVDRYDSSLPF